MIPMIIAIGMAFLLIHYNKSNGQLYGILITRGYGKRGIFKFIFSLIWITLLISYGLGITMGVLGTVISFQSLSKLESFLPSYGNFMIPLKIYWPNIVVILVSIPVVIYTLFSISYLLECRKTTTNFFRKI